MPTTDQLYDELQQAGQLDQAVGKLQEIAAAQPDYALAHSGLAVFLSKLGRHDDAVQHARTVCRLEPDDPFSFMAMSLICQRAGRTAEAEQAMAEAMDRQWAARGEP
jgi:Flp pilus assembly protein TadD